MKRSINLLIAGLAFACAQGTVQAQEFKDHISKSFSLPKAAASCVLSVYNIAGPVKVEGYSGDKILMEIDETITAKDQEILDKGKLEVKLGFDQVGDTLWVYTASPDDSRPHLRNRNYYDNWDEREKIQYHYKFAYTIKVPFGMNLNLSTVNDGDVSVKDVAGKLRVRNVNGAIDIVNAKNTTDARTINGHLTVNYLSNPTEPSSYYTLNGKLTVTYQSDLSADLQFKSMNGQFYTDFPTVTVLPKTVIKTEEKKANGTLYKLNKGSDIRIGSGGKLFKFETLNGNIYIQKQS